MENNVQWTDLFLNNLVNFQKRKHEKCRKFMKYFDLMTVDRAIEFVKDYYKIYLLSHSSPVVSICVSHDESFFASISNDSPILIWSLITKSQICSIPYQEKDVTVLHMTYNSENLLIGTKTGRIHLFNIKEARVDFIFEGHRASIQEICSIPNTTLFISASLDLSILLWNLSSKRCEAYMKKHESYVTCLHVCPNGKYFASGSWDKKVILWNIQKKNSIKTLGNLEKVIKSVCFSKDSKTLAAASGNIIFLYSLNDFSEKQLISHTYTITKVLFYDAETLISVSFDKTIKIWNTSDSQIKEVVSSSPNHCTSIALASNRKNLILGLNDGKLKIVGFDGNSIDYILPGHNKDVYLMKISQNCKILASTCCLNSLAFWDLKVRSCNFVIQKASDSINSFDFSYDCSKLVAGFISGCVEVWELNGYTSLKVVETSGNPINFVLFWSDSYFLVSSHNTEISFWGMEKCEKIVFDHRTNDSCVKAVRMGQFLMCQYKKNELKCFKIPETLLV